MNAADTSYAFFTLPRSCPNDFIIVMAMRNTFSFQIYFNDKLNCFFIYFMKPGNVRNDFTYMNRSRTCCQKIKHQVLDLFIFTFPVLSILYT